MADNRKIKHHYIPKFYLNGFIEVGKTKQLYVYEKYKENYFNTAPDNIGCERNYYAVKNIDESTDTNTIEDFLHEQIESPSHAVLLKIRNQQNISPEEKWIFANYIAYLIRRVPATRKDSEITMTKRIAELTREKWDAEIDLAISKMPTDQDLYEVYRQKIHQIFDKCERTAPGWLFAGHLQYPSPMTTNAIKNMTWRYLVCPKDYFYLTNDNPVFYDKSIGIGNRYSELTLPISYKIALLLTWRTDSHEGYITATSQQVKEINRRTVKNSTRFVFSPFNTEWIITLVNKSYHKLNRLV